MTPDSSPADLPDAGPPGRRNVCNCFQVTYDDVVHGTVGSRWYGDDAIVDRWWPQAMDQWRLALEARSAVGGDRVGGDRVGGARPLG